MSIENSTFFVLQEYYTTCFRQLNGDPKNAIKGTAINVNCVNVHLEWHDGNRFELLVR